MTRRVGAALAAVVLLAACKSSTAAGTPHTLTVSVRDNVFVPQVDSISAGDTVTFLWQGSGMHDLAFADGIGNVSQQATGSTRRGFAAPGIYKYRCTLHSSNFDTGSMIGSIAVY